MRRGKKLTYILEAILIICVELYLIYIGVNGWWVNCKLRSHEERLKVECSILENKIKILEEEIEELKKCTWRIEKEARLKGMVKEGEEIIKFYSLKGVAKPQEVAKP